MFTKKRKNQWPLYAAQAGVGILLALVVLFGVPGFGLHPTVDSKNSVTVQMANGEEFDFSVKVVTTLEDQKVGLQGVDELRNDQGMWFEYEEEGERSFWMKDTLIDLDIIFVNAEGQIITIHNKVPPCSEVDSTQEACPNYTSDGFAQYVLEIKGGVAQSRGFQVGDMVNF
jgi:hypothetical protein